VGYYLAHAGTKLQKITVAGTVSDLTMPTGVTVSATKATQFAALAGSILATYGPTKNVRINASTLGCFPLSITTPSTVITVAVGAAGVLTGDYLYKVSFVDKDSAVVVSESPLSGASSTLTLAAQRGTLSAIPVSTDDGVNCRRLYRTTSGGSVFFFLADIDDNSTTTYSDNIADAALGTTAAATDLGNPAGTTASDNMPLIVAWKDRLWAVWSSNVDAVYYSGINRWYAWSASNFLPINPKGLGLSGVTALLKRRDELGVAKRRGLWKIVGSDAANYQVIQVHAGVGVIAPTSVVVVRDTAYFLAEDGVYAWDASGVRPLDSARVAAWFGTDTYFNRGRFANAFASWNQQEDTYELHLAAADSEVEDRWVSFDLQREVWLGPHKTDVTTPTVAWNLEDIYGRAMGVMGGTNGYLYRCNDTSYEDGAVPVQFDVTTAVLNAGVPGIEKYFGELTVLTAAQASGDMTITPYVGSLSATAGATITHSLTLDRARYRRMGQGREMWLRFQQSTAVGCELHGFEIVPVSIVGTR
jgi:hypothetical protein